MHKQSNNLPPGPHYAATSEKPADTLRAPDHVLKELDRLFDETELEYLRMYLWAFFKSTIEPDFFRFNNQPVIVLETVSHLVRIIDVFDQLLKERPGVSDDPDEYSYTEDAHSGRRYMLHLDSIISEFNGHIRRLSRDEINDLYLVANQFFKADDSHQWKEELKYLQHFALSTDNVWVASDDTSLLTRYELLEKLVEAAYLLHKRRSMQFDSVAANGINAQPQNEDATISSIFLSREEAEDPVSFISSYYRHTGLIDRRRIHQYWFEVVFSNNVWSEDVQYELIAAYEDTLKLIEAAFNLYAAKRHDQEWKDTVLESAIYEFRADYPTLLFLNEQEIDTPWLVVQELCQTDLKEYHERLRYWLSWALTSCPISTPENDVYIYHLIQKLIEALFALINRISYIDQYDPEDDIDDNPNPLTE